MPYTVFISHSSDDLPLVNTIAQRLQLQGITPILAQDVRPTTDPQYITDKVRGLIRRSECVVVLLTKAGMRSNWVHQEIGYALDKKPLIPVVEGGTHPSALAFLQGAEYIPLHPDDVGRSAETLINWITPLMTGEGRDAVREPKPKSQPLLLHNFLPPAAFFARYMGTRFLFHHRLPQVGRRAELNALLSFIEGEEQIAILPGRGGSGKSKLLHTLCRRLERRRPDLNVRLAESLPITNTAIEELPDGSCLVIVDDAHRAAGLEVLLTAARKYQSLKVLLVTRPHATDYLFAQARIAGFDRTEVVVHKPLADLNYRREHRRLARLVLGRDWAHYADRLASVTRDSPLLTVLGGELLRMEQVAPSFLVRHDKFRREVLSRFRDIQFGEIISQLDPRFTPELCAEVLPLVAVLTPLNLENAAMLEAVARLAGTDEVKLRQLLGALVKGGALVRGGRFVRIVPDMLSDFILHEACITDDGLLTGWATRAYRGVASLSLDAVLRNLAELDWRVRTTQQTPDQFPGENMPSETGLLDFVWDQ